MDVQSPSSSGWPQGSDGLVLGEGRRQLRPGGHRAPGTRTGASEATRGSVGAVTGVGGRPLLPSGLSSRPPWRTPNVTVETPRRDREGGGAHVSQHCYRAGLGDPGRGHRSRPRVYATRTAARPTHRVPRRNAKPAQPWRPKIPSPQPRDYFPHVSGPSVPH